MGKSLTPEQEKELELKLEAFEGYIEASFIHSFCNGKYII